MLMTGNQLRAARALAGIDQVRLASLAGVNPNTIRTMEASGPGQIPGRASTVQTVQRTLESQGVEFLSQGRPGVRVAG